MACLRIKDILSTLDLDRPFFKDLEEHNFCLWEQFIKGIGDGNRGVLWLTWFSQVSNCADPEYGTVIGLARKIRTETNVEFATVEIDRLDDSTLECTVKVLNEFCGRFTEEPVQSTAEWAIVDGRALIGRYEVRKNDIFGQRPQRTGRVDQAGDEWQASVASSGEVLV